MHMKKSLALVLFVPTIAFSQTMLYDASIQHKPQDGIVKIYGAGGPHTAFVKVAKVWQEKTGNQVEVIAGPESKWSQQAQADADILWGTSESAITAYLDTYKTFKINDVKPIYLRPVVIAVKKGNPKNIQGFADLLKPGMKIVVTEGGATYNTSGTGTWEDVAGRAGTLSDISQFRSNIVSYAKGSGAAFKAFEDLQADAWLTWPNWPLNQPEKLQLVELESDRKIWRDLNLVVAKNADPIAVEFAAYLTSPEAQAIMKNEGWDR
jgi:accessory colonization factor AcfC